MADTDSIDDQFTFRLVAQTEEDYQRRVNEARKRRQQGMTTPSTAAPSAAPAESVAPAAPTTPEDTAPAEATPPAGESGGSLLGRVGRDALQVFGGARDAVVETMQTIHGVGNWMRERGIGPQGTLMIRVPEIPRAETVEGDIIRSASQFLTAFVPGMKVAKGLGAVAAAPKTAAAIVGAVTDFAAFDPQEPRMSNAINNLAPALKNPVTEFLAANPDDPQALGRFKNTLEGLGLGLMTDGIFTTVQAMSRARQARQLAQATQETIDTATGQVKAEIAGLAPELADAPEVRGAVAPTTPFTTTPALAAKAQALTDAEIQAAVHQEMLRAATEKAKVLAGHRRDLAAVQAGDTEAIDRVFKRLPDAVEAADGSVAVKQSGRMVRYPSKQAALEKVLARRIEGTEAREFFNPRKALESATGVTETAFPTQQDLPDDVLQRMIRERRAPTDPLPETAVRDPGTGRPLKVYHGTGEAFETFDLEKASASTQYGKGLWFAEDPQVSSQYAVGGPAPNVRPVYLDIRHPLEMTAPLSPEMQARAVALLGGEPPATGAELFAKIQAHPLPGDATVQAHVEGLVRQWGLDPADSGHLVTQADIERAEGWLERSGLPAEEVETLIDDGIRTGKEAPTTGDLLQHMQRYYTSHPDVRTTHPTENARKVLEDLGFDGILHVGKQDGRVWIAFRPEQVKPAFEVESAVRLIPSTAQREQATQFMSLQASGVDEIFQRSGKTAHVNFDMVNSADDVKRTIATMADIVKTEAEAQRRGTQSIQEMMTRAGSSKFQDIDKILELAPGSVLPPEDLLAVRQIWVTSANRLHEISQRVAAGDGAATQDFLKQFVLHANIHVQATGLRGEAGRSLRVFGVEMAQTDRHFLTELANTIESANGISIPRLAQMISTIPTPQQLAKFMKDSGDITRSDMLLELWINSLLSGPQTHVVNILSNALTTAWAIPERFLAVGTGNIRAGEATELLWGMKEGMLDGFQAFWQTWRSGVPSGGIGKIEIRHKAISGEAMGLTGNIGRAMDLFGEFVRMPGDTLMAVDEFFKTLNYRMELHAQSYRQAIGEGLEGDALASRIAAIVADPPTRIKDAAENFSFYQTFSQALDQAGAPFESLGRATQKLHEGVNEVPLARLVLPFIRTPFNIARFAAERSPLGLMSANVRQQLMSNTAEGAMARAKMALGTMIMGTVAILSAEGRITGRGPQDPDLRRQLQDAGWQPYSVRVGDHYVAYNRLDPLGTLFGLAADFSSIVGEMDSVTADRVAGALLMSVWQNLSSKTYMKGLSEAVGAVAPKTWADPEQSVGPGSRFFSKLGGSLVPNIVAQANRTMVDPVLRDTQGILDEVMSRIPGFSDNIPPRRTIFGEPRQLQGALGPDFVSPLYSSTRKHNPVADEMIRLRLGISLPPRAFQPDQGAEPIELTAAQYDRYQLLAAGHGLKGLPPLQERLARLMQTGTYQGKKVADELRRTLIRDVIFDSDTGYRALAKAQLRREFPDLHQKLSQGEQTRLLRQVKQGLEPQRQELLPGVQLPSPEDLQMLIGGGR